MINTKKVASFIDNVIMEIEEEVYDKIIEKVKRLVENNLYIKLEKCKWKMREVEFLEVVIEFNEIKMVKVKIKGVLNWSTSWEVKNI